MSEGSLKSWRDFCHCRVPIVKARVEEICRVAIGPKVLEVGCNEGWVAKALMEDRGFDVTAVDNRDKAIQETKDYFGIEAVKADANKLPFEDGSFDTVVGGEILEHLMNPGIGLSEMFRVARKQVIITLPIGKYWLDEPTHAWELNGCTVEHEVGAIIPYHKHQFVIDFQLRRKLNPDGFTYSNI